MNEETIQEIRKKRLQGKTYDNLAMEYQLPLCVVRTVCKDVKNYAKGSFAGPSKLLEAHVKTIKDLLSQGFALKQIAGLYEVSISTICDINTGRSWAHLP